MAAILIGYARCSLDEQDLTAQREKLLELGVGEDRIYLDHGMTGTNRARPGLDQALAAVRTGDTLVVPKLDRLARSVPDARDIGDTLAARGIRLSLGGSIYDPSDPMGKMFFNVLATFAEFEVDLLRMRTRDGMAVARARGKLRGKPPKLSARQQAHLVQLHTAGTHSISDLGEMFSVSRPTVYRCLERARAATTDTTNPIVQAAPATAPAQRGSQRGLEGVTWPAGYAPACPVCRQQTSGLSEARAKARGQLVVVALAQPCGCAVDEYAAALQAGAPVRQT